MAIVLDRLEKELIDCLCRLLEEEARPTCICHLYAGENRPVSDRCNSKGDANGQAWLRRGTSTLVTSAGRPTFGGGLCGSGSGWETTIELGIYRCITAVPGEKGEAPSKEKYEADRALMDADKQTLYGVLCCDTWNDPDLMNAFSIVAARVDPIGPNGACGGSMLTIQVAGEPTEMVEEEVGFVSAPAGGGDSELWPSVFDSTKVE